MSKKKFIIIACAVAVVALIAAFVVIFVEPGLCLECKKIMFEEPDYKYSAYGDIYCNDCAENHKKCITCGEDILVSYEDYCEGCSPTAEAKE